MHVSKLLMTFDLSATDAQILMKVGMAHRDNQ